jgi:hypothetical protein
MGTEAIVYDAIRTLCRATTRTLALSWCFLCSSDLWVPKPMPPGQMP